MAEDHFENWQPEKPATPEASSEPASYEPKTVNNYRSEGEYRDGSFVNVWKNLWSLVTSPTAMANRVKNHKKIGWLYGNIAIVYVIVILISSVIFFSSFSLDDPLQPSNKIDTEKPRTKTIILNNILLSISVPKADIITVNR